MVLAQVANLQVHGPPEKGLGLPVAAPAPEHLRQAGQAGRRFGIVLPPDLAPAGQRAAGQSLCL